MKFTKSITGTAVALLIVFAVMADDKKPVVNEVKGVKQEAIESIEKKDPPWVNPAAAPTPKGVDKVDGVNTVKGVKTPGKAAPTPKVTPKAKGVNQVEGIEAVATNQVKAIPPPPSGAISTIQAVKGVQGIVAPKQQNLEAALLIKEDTQGNPTGTAAAAALLGAPGPGPGPPAPGGDGREDFQQFEKLTTPGS